MLARKTALALATSIATAAAGGTIAFAAAVHLPILGFGAGGSHAAATQAHPVSATHSTVATVVQTDYVDDLVVARTGGQSRRARAAGQAAQPAAASEATTGGSASAGDDDSTPSTEPPETVPPTTGPPTTEPPTTTPPTTQPPSGDDEHEHDSHPGTSVPPPPAGCREPEWDPEHHFWHCSGD